MPHPGRRCDADFKIAEQNLTALTLLTRHDVQANLQGEVQSLLGKFGQAHELATYVSH